MNSMNEELTKFNEFSRFFFFVEFKLILLYSYKLKTLLDSIRSIRSSFI
jgi:hypothetical protein